MTFFPMLASRQHDPEQQHWSMSKYETIHHKPASSTRMSNNFDAPLSTQSEWHGQPYSFIPPGGNPIYAQSCSHGTASNGHSAPQAQPRSVADTGGAMDIEPKTKTRALSPPSSQRRSAGDLGSRQRKQQSPAAGTSAAQGEPYSRKAAEPINKDPVASSDTPGMPLGSNTVSSVSAGQGPELPHSHLGNDGQSSKQEDDDEVIEEYDMTEGDGEAALQQMTPAERTAARRKMKRFR